MFYFHPFFFKIKDPFDGRSFLMCSHDPFFGTNKNRILNPILDGVRAHPILDGGAGKKAPPC